MGDVTFAGDDHNCSKCGQPALYEADGKPLCTACVFGFSVTRKYGPGYKWAGIAHSGGQCSQRAPCDGWYCSMRSGHESELHEAWYSGERNPIMAWHGDTIVFDERGGGWLEHPETLAGESRPSSWQGRPCSNTIAAGLCQQKGPKGGTCTLTRGHSGWHEGWHSNGIGYAWSPGRTRCWSESGGERTC